MNTSRESKRLWGVFIMQSSIDFLGNPPVINQIPCRINLSTCGTSALNNTALPVSKINTCTCYLTKFTQSFLVKTLYKKRSRPYLSWCKARFRWEWSIFSPFSSMFEQLERLARCSIFLVNPKPFLLKATGYNLCHFTFLLSSPPHPCHILSERELIWISWEARNAWGWF